MLWLSACFQGYSIWCKNIIFCSNNLLWETVSYHIWVIWYKIELILYFKNLLWLSACSQGYNIWSKHTCFFFKQCLIVSKTHVQWRAYYILTVYLNQLSSDNFIAFQTRFKIHIWWFKFNFNYVIQWVKVPKCRLAIGLFYLHSR